MRSRIARCLVLLCTALTATRSWGADSETSGTGLRNGIVFSEYTSLSSGAELIRRLFSPLQAARTTERATRLGANLNAQAIDLTAERFSIYVPSRAAPPGGYSLLVFVPPWPAAVVPRKWVSVLGSHAMIFATAANSGNQVNTVGRREPLALLAVHNVMARYPVDAQHVYIGGFSGGSRVALRLALGYPDIFHGALLNAGSDAIGTADNPLPPAELFSRFQESTRLVYVTGEHDDANLDNDSRSRRALKQWCVFGVVTEDEPGKGHEPMDHSMLNRSLEVLLEPMQPVADRLADCRKRVAAELTAQLRQAQEALARGERAAARRLLDEIDARYGGLAAPYTVELSAQ